MKKFKDTKVGQLLSKVAPSVLNVAGDLLPDAGVLGVVKNLIDKDDSIPPQDKEMLHNQLKELYELEVKDRDSARKRQVNFAKTGKIDYMHDFTGIIGLGAFCFMIYAIVYLEIPSSNKEVWINLIGIVQGIVLSIFGFYYGSAVKKNKDQAVIRDTTRNCNTFLLFKYVTRNYNTYISEVSVFFCKLQYAKKNIS